MSHKKDAEVVAYIFYYGVKIGGSDAYIDAQDMSKSEAKKWKKGHVNRWVTYYDLNILDGILKKNKRILKKYLSEIF